MINYPRTRTLLPLLVALTLAACASADEPAQTAANTLSATATSVLVDSTITPEPTADLTATATWILTPPTPTISPTPELLVEWGLETIPPLPPGQPVALNEIQMIDDDNGWAVVAAEGDQIDRWGPQDELDETYDEMIEAYGLMPDLLNPQDRILRTRDGGLTWLEVTPPVLVEVAHDQNGNTYYSPEFLLATTFFLDAETAWAVYKYRIAASRGMGVSKEIWRTTDGGLTWEKGDLVGDGAAYWSSGDGCWTELDFTDQRYGWFKFECALAMQNSDRLLYHTTDGGLTWTLLGSHRDISIPGEMSFINRDQGWGVRPVRGAYHSEFLRSHDSGLTWESQELLIPEVLQDYLNDSPNSDYLWGGCERAYSPELLAPQTGRLVLECDFNSLGTSYYLHTSSNDGASWQSYLLPSDQIAFLNQNLGWALAEDEFGEEPPHLHQTQDGGRTWQPLARLAWNGPFHFIDPQTGFALDYSANPTNLLRTEDGGHTWQPLNPRLADVGLPARDTLSPLTPANLTQIEILDEQTAENATNLAALSFDDQLAVSYADGRLGLWDLDGDYPIIFSWHTDWVYDIAINPSLENGPDLVTASKDGTAKTYVKGSFGIIERTIGGHTGEISTAALYVDLLATGSEDTTIKIWNLDGANWQEPLPLKFSLEANAGWVWDVAFSPDGGLLASASGDHTVRLWDVASGEEMNVLEGHTSTVWRVAFSPDGSLLASASWDETIKLWDVATGQEVRTLSGHTNWLYALDFSPDGALIASGSADGTVRLWEVESGQELYQLTIDGTAVRGLAFTPDGKLLAAVSSGGKLVFWGVRP